MIHHLPGQLVNRARPALGLLVLLCSFSTAAACAPQKHAIQIKQSHYFLGEAVVTAAKDAVRIENIGRFKFIVVARAPDWRVNIFRNDDKTYFTESLQQFEDTGLVSGYLVGRRDRYLDPKQFRRSPLNYLGHSAIRMTGRSRTIKYLPLEKGTAQQVELVVYSTYKLPTCGGLPLDVNNTIDHPDFFAIENNTGRRETYLSTSKIKTVDVSPEQFALPKNYTKAKSVREVVAGSDTRAESVDAQELFESGRSKSRK